MSTEKLIKKLVADNYASIDYPITDKNRAAMVSANIGVFDLTALRDMAILAEVKKQKRLRALESIPLQGALWCNELMDVIIAFKTVDGEAASVKYGAATADHHEQSRAHEIVHLQKTWKAFERQEARRKILMPLLRETPGMTTKEALHSLGLIGTEDDDACDLVA